MAPLVARTRSLLHNERDVVVQAVKTGVAATLAYYLAVVVSGTQLPFFALITAVVTAHVPLYESVWGTVQQFAAIMAGLVVALAVVALAGTHLWAIAAVAVAAVLLARILRLPPEGAAQVPIAGLLLLTIGHADNVSFAESRLYDGLIGAGVGLTVNLTLVPPLRIDPALDALPALSSQIAALLESIARAVRAGSWGGVDAGAWLARGRQLRHTVEEAERRLADARQSLRWHPLRRRTQPRVARITEALVALEHGANQLRGISRTIADVANAPGAEHPPLTMPRAYAEAMTAAAHAVRAFTELVASDEAASSPAGHRLADAVVDGQEACARLVEEVRPTEGAGDAWLVHASLITDLRRLLHELDCRRGPHRAAIVPELADEDQPSRR